MPERSRPGAPAFHDLAHPRSPAPAELRLLSWLSATLDEELTGQVADAVVVGACSCGCSSVRLSTSAPPAPAETLARLVPTDRPEVVALRSTGRGPDGHAITLTLHVIEGRLRELEIFDADAGEGVAVDLSAVTGWEPPQAG
jgi:hypothetical protein